MANDSPAALLERCGTHHWRSRDQRWLVDLKDDGYLVTDTVGARSFFTPDLERVHQRIAISR